MEFLELMRERYTTKAYDETKKILNKDIEKLKEILRLSPSSINGQPWKFTFVENEDIKHKLAHASRHNTDKVLNCSQVVVFSAINNKQLFERQIEASLPERTLGYYNKYLKDLPEPELFHWINNQVYITLGFFLSACAAMGIDSTAMEGIERDDYASIIGLKNYEVLFAVTIGYRDSEDPNQLDRKEKIRYNNDMVIEVL